MKRRDLERHLAAHGARKVGESAKHTKWRSADGTELRIYTTPIPTDHRLPTLMHDTQYRLAVAWQNVGYNQPPHPSFYLGDGMKPPPKVRMKLK